jgi:hypothetical protein
MSVSGTKNSRTTREGRAAYCTEGNENRVNESPVDRIEFSPGLVEHARMFLRSGKQPTAKEVRDAIRQAVREYLTRRLTPASGVVSWSPPPLFRGHDQLQATTMHGQPCVFVRGRSSSLDFGLDRSTQGVTRVSMVQVREMVASPVPDRLDPVTFRWDANVVAGREIVTWGFKRGRVFEAMAWRPLGSDGPWSGTFTGEYEAGETLPWPPGMPLIANSLLDDQRIPRFEEAGIDELMLLEDAMVTLHRTEEPISDLAGVFADLIRFVPDGDLDATDRTPHSRLRGGR